MVDETKVDAAQRLPKGRAYPTGTSGGVEYKTPVGPNPVEEEQVYSILNEKGQEVPDPEPMEVPIGYSTGPSLADFVQRTIHNALSQRAAEEEFETFEEQDDFDIEDDPVDPLTPYEAHFFMPKPTPVGVTGEVAQPAPAVTRKGNEKVQVEENSPPSQVREPAGPLTPASGTEEREKPPVSRP